MTFASTYKGTAKTVGELIAILSQLPPGAALVAMGDGGGRSVNVHCGADQEVRIVTCSDSRPTISTSAER